MRTAVKRSRDLLLDSIFPRHCPVCGHITVPGTYWHEGCLSVIPAFCGPRCRICGIPLENEEERAAGTQRQEDEGLCPVCRSRPREFSRAFSVFPYAGPLKDALYALKFRGRQEYGKALGALLYLYGSSAAALWDTGLIACVPAHPRRIRERGYDQAALLAAAYAEEAGGTFSPDLLVRAADTPALKGLGRQEREKILADAFRCGSVPPCGRILLIDDIYTTGSTAEAAAKVLRGSGAEEVFVLALCSAKMTEERF